MTRHNRRVLAHALREFAAYADDAPLQAAVTAATVAFAVVAVVGSMDMRWKARLARSLARRIER